MRDAFGGIFTINLLMVFIVIYVAFTAVSLNYARAFRVKNAVIDYIEQNEVSDLDSVFGFLSTKDLSKLDESLMALGYNKTCEEIGYEDNRLVQNITNIFQTDMYCYKGVVITENKNKSQKIDGTTSEIKYYNIHTYANWDLGILNKLLVLSGKSESSETGISDLWSINGEAKVITKK